MCDFRQWRFCGCEDFVRSGCACDFRQWHFCGCEDFVRSGCVCVISGSGISVGVRP